MRRIVMISAVGLVLLGVAAVASARYPHSSAVDRVRFGTTTQRTEAIAALRDAGPQGLKELVTQRNELKDQLATAEQAAAETLLDELKKLDAAIDEVGGARYCSSSQLYWFTDIAKAKAEAERTNKPILSLRMLGKLTEEFSCANSRFFRTTLYANQQISATLRDKFVLHWESVRPVPRITIDFGDGRKLERTVTGNSIHYVLDATGRPLDGLPGLYGPAAFHAWLHSAADLAKQYQATPAEQRDNFLCEYHRAQLAKVDEQFRHDLVRVQLNRELAVQRTQSPVQAQSQSPPPAAAAAGIAAPKRRAEIGIIREVAAERTLPATTSQLDDATWQQLAALHAPDSQLDSTSIALIRSENPSAVQAGRLAVTKAFVEDPLARLVRTFQSSIALDTVRNEYVLHRKLHEWYANNEADSDLFRLNERVYAELFLTPSSDPWLGLMTPNTYTALQDNGIRQASAQP